MKLQTYDEMKERERLHRENPLHTRCTHVQIRAMLGAEHPEWFGPALRMEAEDRGMRAAPYAETPFSDVVEFLRKIFP